MEDGDLTIVVRTQHSSGGLELLRSQTSDAWQHLAQILVGYGFWMLMFSFVAQIIVNPHLFPIYNHIYSPEMFCSQLSWVVMSSSPTKAWALVFDARSKRLETSGRGSLKGTELDT